MRGIRPMKLKDQHLDYLDLMYNEAPDEIGKYSERLRKEHGVTHFESWMAVGYWVEMRRWSR